MSNNVDIVKDKFWRVRLHVYWFLLYTNLHIYNNYITYVYLNNITCERIFHFDANARSRSHVM